MTADSITEDALRGKGFLLLVLVCLAVAILTACAAGPPKRKSPGGIDWGSFDYRKSSQVPGDNDADYRLPVETEPCLRDGITGEVFCE